MHKTLVNTTFFASWILVLALFSAPTMAQDARTTFDDRLESAADSASVPGAVWALVVDDEIHLGQYGLADRETGRAMDAENTMFRIASVSKVINAAAAASLIADGRLSAHEDLQASLPWLGPGYTLRQLLTHTSGLEDPTLGNAARTPDEVQTLESFLRSRLPVRSSEPGAMIRYSNRGAALAGLAIANTVNLPYAEAIQLLVFDAFGMTSSSFDVSNNERLLARKAKTYACGDCPPSVPTWSNIPPAGSMHSTARDLAQFMRSLFADSLLASVLFERQVSMHDEMDGLAMALAENDIAGHRSLMHPGRSDGYRTEILLVPDLRTGLFIASTGGSARFADQARMAFGELISHADYSLSGVERIENTGDYAGAYLDGRAPRETVEAFMALFHYGSRVGADSGYLTRYEGGQWVRYGRLDGDLFRAVEGSQKMFFQREGGKVVAMHESGRGYPSSHEQLSWWRVPATMNEIASFAGALPALAVLCWPLLFLAIWAYRRAKQTGRARLPDWKTWVFCAVTSVLILVFLFGFMAGLGRLIPSGDIQYDLPARFSRLLILPWVITALVAGAVGLTVRSWTSPTSWVDRLMLVVVAGSGIVFVFLLAYFNFLPAVI